MILPQTFPARVEEHTEMHGVFWGTDISCFGVTIFWWYTSMVKALQMNTFCPNVYILQVVADYLCFTTGKRWLGGDRL